MSLQILINFAYFLFFVYHIIRILFIGPKCVTKNFMVNQISHLVKKSNKGHLRYAHFHLFNVVASTLYAIRFFAIVAGWHNSGDIFAIFFALFRVKDDDVFGCVSGGLFCYSAITETRTHLNGKISWHWRLFKDILDRKEKLQTTNQCTMPFNFKSPKPTGLFKKTPEIIILKVIEHLDRMDQLTRFGFLPVSGALIAFAGPYLFFSANANMSIWWLPLAWLDVTLYSYLMVMVTINGLSSIWLMRIMAMAYSGRVNYDYKILRMFSKLRKNYNPLVYVTLNLLLKEHTKVTVDIMRSDKAVCAEQMGTLIGFNLPINAYLLFRLVRVWFDFDGTSWQNMIQPVLILLIQGFIGFGILPLANLSSIMHKSALTVPAIQLKVPSSEIRMKLKLLAFYERVHAQDQYMYGFSLGPSSAITFSRFTQFAGLYFAIFSCALSHFKLH